MYRGISFIAMKKILDRVVLVFAPPILWKLIILKRAEKKQRKGERKRFHMYVAVAVAYSSEKLYLCRSKQARPNQCALTVHC